MNHCFVLAVNIQALRKIVRRLRDLFSFKNKIFCNVVVFWDCVDSEIRFLEPNFDFWDEILFFWDQILIFGTNFYFFEPNFYFLSEYV